MATKEQIRAVEKTRDMWRWLEENPHASKKDYLLKVLSPKERPIKIDECFLCDIWRKRGDLLYFICEGCPLYPHLTCSQEADNPFQNWVKAGMWRNFKKRVDEARRIRIACERWLYMNEITTTLLSEFGWLNPKKMTNEANFKTDLEADSLDRIEFIMAIEDKYGVEIPDEVAEKIITLGDMVDVFIPYIEKEREKNGASKFNIGDKVHTNKGGRFDREGPFTGKIVGFSKWRNYDAANVRKDLNGRVVQCLLKNLELIKP
jgi:acyl carrier protein